MPNKKLKENKHESKVIKFSNALQRDCILILGMKNSGEAAVSEGIHDIYNLHFTRKNTINSKPEKYKARKEISFLNDKLLAHFGLGWDSITSLPENWKDEIDNFGDRQNLKTLLLDNFNYDGPIIINDSKLLLVLPIWLDLLKELDYNTKVVIVHRHPNQVALAYKERENFSTNKSHLIYINYMKLAEKLTRNLNRIVVDYDQLSKSPEKIITESIRILDNNLTPGLTCDLENILPLLQQNEVVNKIFVSEKEESIVERTCLKLNKLYRSILNGSQNNLVYTKLDVLYNRYDEDFAAFYKGILYAHNNLSKLVLSFKNGNQKVLTQQIQKGRQIISFDIKQLNDIESISFYPSNELSYLKLGTISALTDDNEQKINFSSFNNIIQHSNNYIVNSDSRIFVDFSTFSNNTRSIDFEITLLAVGRPILQYIEKLAAKKDSWFQEHLSEKDNQLLKVLAKKKTISKERKKAIKRLKRLTELNAEQSSKLDELTLLNTELQTEINSKSFFHKQDFEQEKQLNTQLGLQLTSKENQLEAEQQKCHQLNLELQKEKQRLTELSQQIKIEQQKQQALLNDLQDEKRKLDPFNKIIADHEKVLVEKSSLIKEFKKKSKKQKKAFADLKLNEDSLKSEALQLQSKLNNTLSTTEKYKSEVTELQNLSEKRNDVIQKQHLEILKFKRDYAALENYNTALKQSKSYKLGRFFTAPFRYLHDLIFDSNLVKNRSWIYFGAFFILLRYPFRFLRHANSNNMATLKKAIKNEPPKQILNNLKNLVVTGKSKPVGIVNQVKVSNSTSPAYMSKWDTFLKNKEIAKSSSRSKILYISPELPQYDMSSGGKRATRMLSLLAEEMEVFVYTTGVKAEKYINKLEENGVRVVINPDIDSLRNKIAHFDSIIFAWYYSYLETHRFTELYPNAKIIVDSVDVHWVREERSIGNWEGFTAEMAAKNKEGEVYTYQQADIVWAVTDNDKAAINNEIPGKDIRVISNIHTPIVNEYVDPQNNNMLFFGGFSHYPNISAVKMLVHQILPLVQKEIPDCKVIIAGSNATQEIKELGQVRGVDFRGFIEEEDVTALYNETFLSVSPLLAGAGIKGKICEAISYMTPVVTNGIGNEGINLENETSGFIAEEIEALATLIIKAMRREYDMVKITKQAQEKMAHLIGPDIVKERMIASITPEITICIVTYNRMDLLKRCIESIEGNTKYPRYKIVVHSNGCTDGTVQYLEAAAVINKRIIPVLSEKNEVFVIPNNNMMMMYEENDVVLLNNDTYVTNNWLTELYNAAYSSSKIGIAGSKILYPDGKLQEFGSELYENGSGRNIGKWENPDLDAYQKMKRAGYVSGCSMYIKRSTIKKLGVFDLQFHPCYCEDSDYCYTAWENDIQTIVTPNSVVYHDEGATSGTDTSSGFKKYQEVNFKKFLQKHKTKLAETQSKIESLNGNPIKLSE